MPNADPALTMSLPQANRRNRAAAIGLFLAPLMCVALIAAAATATAADTLTGVASVIDGDTIEVHGQRIRLHGIDAPESRQLCRRADGSSWRCGQQAALALSDRIGRGAVACEAKDRDRYGRIVAVCRKGGEDLNAWMVRQGWAVAYRRYSTDYVRAEAEARGQQRNIWSGEFVMPWDWRRRQRLAGEGGGASNAPKPGCDIKGNISSSGERIYHVPGGRWHAKTRIDTAKGERWFCSEAEAKAAGWRRARQQ
jgi:endonuclease YncB( thermonuclease family)